MEQVKYFDEEEVYELSRQFKGYPFRNKVKPYVREGHKIHRNDLCTCGSGKKYKKCCLNK